MKPVTVLKHLRPAQVARFVSPAKSLEAYQREHAPKITQLNTQCSAMCAIMDGIVRDFLYYTRDMHAEHNVGRA